MKVAAVVPAYNVAKYIGKTIKEMQNCPFIDAVIVVDDCSTDATYDIASKTGVILIRHSKNKGVGAAIKTGFKKALEIGSDVAVIVAGDGQMPVFELPKFLEKCEDGFGLVIGNRFAENDPRDFGMPTIRYYGAKILSFMTYISTGYHIPDSQNGYTALTKETLQRINLDALANRWGVHNDIISRCSVAGVSMTTVPQVSKFLDDDGKRIKSKVWVWNIILPNLFVFFKASIRRILSFIGIKQY